MENVQECVSQTVEVGSWKQWPDVLDINRTEVIQTKESVTVCADRLTKEIEAVELTVGRRKDISAESNQLEVRKVRSMAGKLGYLGVVVSPIA